MRTSTSCTAGVGDENGTADSNPNSVDNFEQQLFKSDLEIAHEIGAAVQRKKKTLGGNFETTPELLAKKLNRPMILIGG